MDSLPLELLGTLTDVHGNLLIELLHSPAHRVLYIRWFGNLTGREVSYASQEVARVQAELHYPLLLNDKSNATGDWSEAMDWVEYEVLPQVLNSGLRAIAYVFSPDMHNQLISLRFFERVKQYLPIQMFYDLPSAWQWLRRYRLPPSAAGLEPDPA